MVIDMTYGVNSKFNVAVFSSKLLDITNKNLRTDALSITIFFPKCFYRIGKKNSPSMLRYFISYECPKAHQKIGLFLAIRIPSTSFRVFISQGVFFIRMSKVSEFQSINQISRFVDYPVPVRHQC